MMERLPNVLIIGAQKSGTSWFARLLSQHPDIYFYESEIHFFDKTYNYRKGIEWYKGHFNNAPATKWIGEKTPDYLWANGLGEEGHAQDVHKRIFRHLPDVKLIVKLVVVAFQPHSFEVVPVIRSCTSILIWFLNFDL